MSGAGETVGAGVDPGPRPREDVVCTTLGDTGGDGHWGEGGGHRRLWRAAWHRCSLGVPFRGRLPGRASVPAESCSLRRVPFSCAHATGQVGCFCWLRRRAVTAPRAPSCTAQPVSRLGLPARSPGPSPPVSSHL